MQSARSRLALVVAAGAACEFNEEINVAPQSVVHVEALGACPQDGPDGDPAASWLDLTVVSDLDRLVEKGRRVARGPEDNCTVSDGESDDPDACRLDVGFGDATVRAAFAMGEGEPASIAAGAPRWCDANGACAGEAGDGAPLHLAIVFDAGDGAEAFDPQNARLAAAKGLVDRVLCAGRDDVPGCPFTDADEVRFWTLSSGDVREEGIWISDAQAAIERIDAIQARPPGGDARIFDALAGEDGVISSVSRRGGDGDGRAVVLIVTDGDDPTSSKRPQDVPAGVPVHVLSLATQPSIAADLRHVACATGGSYRAVADAGGYASALGPIRYGLRGRWRVEAALSGLPEQPDVYEFEASATVSVEGGDEIPNPQLTFQVQR